MSVGALGHQVAGDLRDLALAVDPEAPVGKAAWDGSDRAAAHLRRDARAALIRLLPRARSEGTARLDVFVLGEATPTTASGFAEALSVIAEVLAESWPVLLPADTAPNDRTVWGAVGVVLPPMRGALSEPGVRALQALEAHKNTSPHPVLARAFLLPRQTRAMVLDDEAAGLALRGLGMALYLSKSRKQDAIRALVAHRNDDRWALEVGVGLAEVPVAPLVRYARARVALDALGELVARAERPTGDPSRAEALVARLGADALLEGFREGEAASRVRRHAATLSGATDGLPGELSLRLAERESELKSRFRLLLGPASRPPPDRATEHPEHGEVLRLLDQEEAFAAQEITRRVDVLLSTELEPATALEVLPHLEAALARARHHIDEVLRTPPAPLPPPDPPPPPIDLGRGQLEAAVTHRPRASRLLPFAAGLGLIAWTLSALCYLALTPDSPPAVAAVVTGPADPSPWWALLIGAVVGIGAAALATLAWLHAGRLELQDALRARRDELQALWRQGGAGQPGRQAQALLTVRYRRTAAAIAATLRRGTERLQAARAALRVSRDAAARELERMRVRVAASPRQDDLTALVGQESPLRTNLADPVALADAIAGCRTVIEPARLAQALLIAAWPTRGIVDDLPALDSNEAEDALTRLAGDVLRAALHAVGPGALRQRLIEFWKKVQSHLSWGLDPRDVHGERLNRSPTWMIVGPTTFRSHLEEQIEARAGAMVVVMGPDAPPWLVVLAVSAPWTVDEIVRGSS